MRCEESFVVDGGGKKEDFVASVEGGANGCERKCKKDDSVEAVDDNIESHAKKKCRSIKNVAKLPYTNRRTKHNVREKKASKVIHNRREFPYGSIVAINSFYMDHYNWPNRNEAPTFLELVENPIRHEGR